MKSLLNATRASVVLMLLCGLLYPLATTGLAQALMPEQAEGSLIEQNGQLIGSKLIAQDFTSPNLFHPRMSAAKYDPKASAATQAAIASEDYLKGISENVQALKRENGYMTDIPADLVTTSGSGFDPDLSPEAVRAQVPRIARATGLREAELNRLIDEHVQGRQLGVFGEPRVNVLELNLDLIKKLKR